MEIQGYIPGPTTTQDAVKVMTAYARKDFTDYRVRDLAEQIVSDIHPSDTRSQMLAIVNYICNNMQYVKDDKESQRLFGITSDNTGELEMVKSPVSVIESRRYDCDCAATLIAAMLMALGIKPRFIVVGFFPEEMTGPDGFEHTYCQGYDEDSCQWVILDPVSEPRQKQMIADTKQFQIYEI